jgi:hypothetical protein
MNHFIPHHIERWLMNGHQGRRTAREQRQLTHCRKVHAAGDRQLQKTNPCAFCQTGKSYGVIATNGRHLNNARITPHGTQDLIQHCR